jgi:PAS domain S-box-containing protein
MISRLKQGTQLRPAARTGAGRNEPYKKEELVTASMHAEGERVDRCLRSISETGCELEQASLDAIITTDPKGKILSCSAAACDLLGILPGEAIGRHVSSFYAGGVGEARLLMQQLKDKGRIRDYITEIRTPAGRRTPVALSASAVRNSAGEIIGTLGVARNLTEIRRLEDELNKKNRFMANILQYSADAIMTMDPEDNVTSWNRGAEAIFGYSAAEMIGKSVSMIVPPNLQEAQELDLRRRRQLADFIKEQCALVRLFHEPGYFSRLCQVASAHLERCAFYPVIMHDPGDSITLIAGS